MRVEPFCAPFLKWAGGKQQLLPVLRQLRPQSFERYFEPFIGGGAQFFDLQPAEASLADANEELVNCFIVVRDQLDALLEHLDRHRNTEAYFYAIRRQDPGRMGSIARASRLIFLNRTCFNGLYRVNRRGEFNVPYGRYRNPVLKPEARLRVASAALQGARIEAADFRASLRNARAGDFVYLDPPYIPLGGHADFRRYHRQFFTTEDHQELADLFADLDRRGCRVLLSNSDTPVARKLFAGWNQVVVSARRLINCDASRRNGVQELIVANYELAGTS